MNYPWGISGPDFLALYVAVLALVLGIAVLVRIRLRRPRVAPPAQRVGVREIAFLAGGPRRVVETAVARLVESGAVRPSRDGRLTAVESAATDDPIENVVLRVIGAKSRAVDSVLRKASTSRTVTRIGDALVEQGLLVGPASARAVRRRPDLALYLLLVIGMVRLVDGIADGHPVVYLAGLLALTVVMIIVLRMWKVPARTVHGDRVLAMARSQPSDTPDLWLDPVSLMAWGGTLGLVALGGLALYPDLMVRHALTMSLAPSGAPASATSCSTWTYLGTSVGNNYASCSSSSSSSSDGGASGSSCGSSGSSCGGGGGCGGGCGSS